MKPMTEKCGKKMDAMVLVLATLRKYLSNYPSSNFAVSHSFPLTRHYREALDMFTSGTMYSGCYDLETKRSRHTERSTIHANSKSKNPSPRANAVLVLIGRRASGADLVLINKPLHGTQSQAAYGGNRWGSFLCNHSYLPIGLESLPQQGFFHHLWDSIVRLYPRVPCRHLILSHRLPSIPTMKVRARRSKLIRLVGGRTLVKANKACRDSSSEEEDVPRVVDHNSGESVLGEEWVHPPCKRDLLKANKRNRDSSSEEDDIPEMIDHNSGDSMLGEEWVHPPCKRDLFKANKGYRDSSSESSEEDDAPMMMDYSRGNSVIWEE